MNQTYVMCCLQDFSQGSGMAKRRVALLVVASLVMALLCRARMYGAARAVPLTQVLKWLQLNGSKLTVTRRT